MVKHRYGLWPYAVYAAGYCRDWRGQYAGRFFMCLLKADSKVGVMMHRYQMVILILSVMMTAGCRAASDNVSDSEKQGAAVEATERQHQKASDTGNDVSKDKRGGSEKADSTNSIHSGDERMPKLGQGWISYENAGTEGNVASQFQKVQQIIQQIKGMPVHLSHASILNGDWGLIHIQRHLEHAENALDDEVYIVNLVAESIVKNSDWKAVKPLLDDMLKTGSGEMMELDILAKISAVVAFGHDRYFVPEQGKTYPDGISGPKLHRTNDKTVFEFAVQSRSNQEMFTRCKLVMAGNGVFFVSELVGVPDIRQKIEEN